MLEQPLLLRGDGRTDRSRIWPVHVFTVAFLLCVLAAATWLRAGAPSAEALLTVAPPSSDDHGTIVLRIDGVPRAYTLAALQSTSSALVNVSGNTLSLERGPSAAQGTRLWVANDATLASDSYVHFELLGKRLSYTIDLSSVGCSCNAALYWVSMPGYVEGGALAPGTFGNYYCDANKVNGVWCWEHDTIEANMFAMQVAAHSCSELPGRYIAECDRGGAGINSWRVNSRGLCPREECIIDSRLPFRHAQTFVADADGTRLIAIDNQLEQGGRTFTFSSGRSEQDRAYLNRMSAVLREGMVLTFQLWGGPWELMWWLDAIGPDPDSALRLCTGDCPPTSRVVFSDVEIQTLEVGHRS